MINENSTLRQMARESLKGKWNIVVPTFLLYFLIIGGIEYLGEIVPTLSLLTIIVSGPIVLGISIFSLNIARNKDARIEQLFEGFRNFGTSIIAYVFDGSFYNTLDNSFDNPRDYRCNFILNDLFYHSGR